MNTDEPHDDTTKPTANLVALSEDDAEQVSEGSTLDGASRVKVSRVKGDPQTIYQDSSLSFNCWASCVTAK